MPETEFTLGTLAGKIDALSARVDEFKRDTEEEFARVHRRLAEGDRRFRRQDVADAAEVASAAAKREADERIRKVATKVGTWVLSIAGAVGLAALSHIPWLAEWLVPPKGH